MRSLLSRVHLESSQTDHRRRPTSILDRLNEIPREVRRPFCELVSRPVAADPLAGFGNGLR